MPDFFNPYSSIADTYVSGLAVMVDGIVIYSGWQGPEQLTIEVASFLQEAYFPDEIPLELSQQLQAIVGNIYWSYVNHDNPFAISFTEGQLAFINQTILDWQSMTASDPDIAKNYFQDAEQKLGNACLTTWERAPIFMAFAIAEEAYNFFWYEIKSPDKESWKMLLNPDPAVNYANLPGWIIGIFTGVLIGIIQSTSELPADSPQGVGLPSTIMMAVAGGLTLTFGQIAFGWPQRSYPTP